MPYELDTHVVDDPDAPPPRGRTPTPPAHEVAARVAMTASAAPPAALAIARQVLAARRAK